MKEYPFFAMMARMKYIERWALMRNSEKENISEHSMEVAMLAHGLGIISREKCGKDVDLDKAVDANHQLRHPSIAPDKRDAFFSKLNHGFTKTIRELYPQFYYKQELKALLVKMKILHGEE